jgi:predicted permease
MDGMRRDVAYAVRRMLRSPVFTLVAVVSLSLGIGANTAIFSFVDAVLLRSSSVEDPDRLVDVYTRQEGFSHGALSYPDLQDLDRRTEDVFEGFTYYRLGLFPSEGESGGVEMLPAQLVPGDFFTVQGLDAAVGRTLLPEDHVAEGAHPVVALSHGFWQRRFAGDPGVVGREIRISGQMLTVVGVVEEGFTGSLRGLVPDLYVPVLQVPALDPVAADLGERGNQSYFAVGRLLEGVGVEQARQALVRETDWLRATYPDFWAGDEGVILEPTTEVVVNPMIDRVLVPALGLLVAVVGVVLLIACANLASFLLARAADRQREIAVRLAVGARRSNLVRQLLTETLVLGALGGIGGAALGWGLLRLLDTADLPLPLPISLDLRLSGPVLAYTAGITVLAGILFGLAPALQASRPDLASTLRNERGGERVTRFSLRNVLVVAQVAGSLVLLVGAGLLVRSLVARQSIDPGFGSVQAALVEVSAGRGVDEGEVDGWIRDLEAAVADLDGVRAVGLTTNLHLNTLNTSTISVEVDGVAPPAGRDAWPVDRALVDPDFFDAMAMEVRAGRVFEDADGPEGAPVAVVNQAFVDRFFPDGDALGRTVRLGRDAEEFTVVGVVATAKVRSLGEAPRPFVYQSLFRSPSPYVHVVARTEGVDPRAVALRISAAARDLAPDTPVFSESTMERHLAVVLLPARLGVLLGGAFALLATTLAALGLYGVVSYAVSRRVREVGIRMSLGADAGQVVRMLMGEGLQLVAVGMALGLAASVAFGILLSRFLYGVGGLDPMAFGSMAALLAVVALGASWIPARRATRVDPVRALKAE